MSMGLCDKNNLIETLIELIKTPSITGEEKDIAEKVFRQLEQYGLTPKMDEYHNVLAEMGSGKTLLLNAHLDTVPPGEGWTFNPYSGKIMDGKIYGLGASDNKSGVTAMLEIARILTQREINGKVIFLFTSREESGKKESRKALVGRVKAQVGLCLDHHIHAEKKIVEGVIGCRGIANFTLRIHGKAYHSSEPDKGINAVYRAFKIVQAIQKTKLPSMKKPVKEKSVVSITRINTNGWSTRIPDLCRLTINYRALPTEKKDEIEKRIMMLSKKNLKKNFQLSLDEYEDGYLINPNEEIVKTAKKSAGEMGFKWKVSVAKGWVDAAMFTNILNIPTICLGTTTYGQAHVKDEYEEIENLLYGSEIVLKTVLNFLS